MVKGGYGPIKQVTLDPSRCSRSNAATVGRPDRPSIPVRPFIWRLENGLATNQYCPLELASSASRRLGQALNG